MNIFLVRHGESEFNTTGIHQLDNIPLSKAGKKQAKVLAERMKNMNIDIIYSSNLKRASQTAEVISSVLVKKVTYMKDLHEFINPSEIKGLSYESPKSKKIKKLMDENISKGNWKYSDEESYNEMRDRAIKVIDFLFKKHREQNVVCITHGTFMKMLTAICIFGDKLTPSTFLEFRKHLWMANTGITQIEHTDKWGWGLITWNDTTHL